MRTPEFDTYRAEYPGLDFFELSKWHSRLWREHPDQKHYNALAMRTFLLRADPRSIREIGGWRGEAAAEFLPMMTRCEVWTNVEICREAVEHSLCGDPRYIPIHDATYDLTGAEAGIMSHVIEHMSDAQAETLIRTTDVQWLFIDAPLRPGGQKWNHDMSFHTMRMGWASLETMIFAAGFQKDGELAAPPLGDAKWYTR